MFETAIKLVIFLRPASAACMMPWQSLRNNAGTISVTLLLALKLRSGQLASANFRKPGRSTGFAHNCAPLMRLMLVNSIIIKSPKYN